MIFKKITTLSLSIYNTIGKYIWRKPKIKSIDETIDYILNNQCSVSRFGDGEFAIIQGNYNGFQEKNGELGNRLAEILVAPVNNHIVCLPDVFGNLKGLKKSSKEFNNGLLRNERRAWLKLLNIDRQYYNAFFTRCYNMFEDKTQCRKWFSKNKKIWEKKNILIVEGEFSRLGVGNDLFANAANVQRILAPAQNAYSKYNEIFEAAKKYGEGKLVLIALGMTATVLAYDLAKCGIQAIDIGHIDIEYEWYLMGADNKVAISGKYVNEVKGGDLISNDIDKEYLEEYLEEIILEVI